MSSAASLVSTYALASRAFQSITKKRYAKALGANGGDLRLMVDSRKGSAVRWRSKEYSLFLFQ